MSLLSVRRVMPVAAAVTLAIAATPLILAQQTQPTPRQPAVRGVLPGGPIFDPARPKPPAGSVLDIESLLVAPSDEFRIERRNNFYKKDGSDGLYRWAASGHWSNYDEAKTGNWKATVPDLLTLTNGRPVRTAADWRDVRRPEVVRLLETHIYGRIPANVPRVVWTAGELVKGETGGIATVSRTITGRFVNADGTPFTPPASTAPAAPRAGGPAPAAAPAGGPTAPPRAGGPAAGTPAAPRAGGPAAGTPSAPAAGGPGFGRGLQAPPNGLAISYTVPANAPGRVPLIQGGNAAAVLGMGFGTVSFAGNAPNVTSTPAARDDWGEIRKYGWVVSRALDYLETDPLVDARQVALTGHSIGGKRALVAGAFDERIGLVFASCSGEGGASMMKRDWGETIDDLAQLSPQNYADNFQMWVRHWDEMPADAHMLVALMAPRPLFITGGTEDQWSDPVGVFWSGYYASPVYELLGKKGLGAKEPPQPNVFLDGDLTFYNHKGGHITTPEESAKYLELVKKHLSVKAR